VNGFQAIPGDWGWQVSLTNMGRHFCGGEVLFIFDIMLILFMSIAKF